MCKADLDFTGGKNDIGAGTDTDFIGACTPALTVRSAYCVLTVTDGLRTPNKSECLNSVVTNSINISVKTLLTVIACVYAAVQTEEKCGYP